MIPVPIFYFVVMSFAFFAIGIVGLTATKHFVLMILSIELALLASTLLATIFFYITANADIMTLLFAIWAIAATEAIAMVAFYRYISKYEASMDISKLSRLGDE